MLAQTLYLMGANLDFGTVAWRQGYGTFTPGLRGFESRRFYQVTSYPAYWGFDSLVVKQYAVADDSAESLFGYSITKSSGRVAEIQPRLS